MTLPVVNADVAYSVAHKLKDGKGLDFDEYLEKHLAQIRRADPTIASFIEDFPVGTPLEFADEEVRFWARCCGLMVYEFLRSQAEANKLKEELKGRPFR